MAELLADTALDDPQREQVAAIRDSAEALLEIINDILDFSKIEAGRLVVEPHPFRLRERLDALVKSFALRLHGKDVALTLDVAADAPDPLVGDARLLRQVLANLLSNAVKFTERGAVTLRARPREQAGDRVTLEFEVSDTGIGIPEEKQQIIFDEFVQADASTTRRYGGTGLGLAIATRLVDALGGEIGLTSAPGAGSTFRVTARFRRDAAGSEAEVPAAEPVVELRPLSVLLVEDSVANQRVATGLLQKARHAVRVAASGAAAVEACETGRFDVVLMDLQMPDMDGYAATRAIRRRERERNAARTPIVALTARTSRGSEAACLSAGFDGYLLKPYRSRELTEAIAAGLRRAAAGLGRAAQTAPADDPPADAAPADGAASAGTAADDARAADPSPAAGARLDWTSAIESLDGDRELLRAVLDGFLGQHASLTAELRDAIAADDRPTAGRVAHTIAGSLRMFRDARAVALAEALEDTCRSAGPEPVTAAWRALAPELDSAVAEIRAWAGKNR